MTLLFDHSPDLEKLWSLFPESPYFSPEALWYKIGGESTKSGIIVASIWGTIAGVLSWENDGRLKIWQVEVSPEYRGLRISSSLIQEAERVNLWRAHEAIGYLNGRRNESSAKMFQRAGYTRKDEQKFYKVL